MPEGTEQKPRAAHPEWSSNRFIGEVLNAILQPASWSKMTRDALWVLREKITEHSGRARKQKAPKENSHHS